MVASSHMEGDGVVYGGPRAIWLLQNCSGKHADTLIFNLLISTSYHADLWNHVCWGLAVVNKQLLLNVADHSSYETGSYVAIPLSLTPLSPWWRQQWILVASKLAWSSGKTSNFYIGIGHWVAVDWPSKFEMSKWEPLTFAIILYIRDFNKADLWMTFWNQLCL